MSCSSCASQNIISVSDLVVDSVVDAVKIPDFGEDCLMMSWKYHVFQEKLAQRAFDCSIKPLKSKSAAGLDAGVAHTI